MILRLAPRTKSSLEFRAVLLMGEMATVGMAVALELEVEEERESNEWVPALVPAGLEIDGLEDGVLEEDEVGMPVLPVDSEGELGLLPLRVCGGSGGGMELVGVGEGLEFDSF
jgi:hypothetical protein